MDKSYEVNRELLRELIGEVVTIKGPDVIDENGDAHWANYITGTVQIISITGASAFPDYPDIHILIKGSDEMFKFTRNFSLLYDHWDTDASKSGPHTIGYYDFFLD